MLTMIALILFFAVFTRILFFALKLGWGMIKLTLFVVFLPAIILLMIFGGLAFAAVPVLAIAGIVSLAVKAC